MQHYVFCGSAAFYSNTTMQRDKGKLGCEQALVLHYLSKHALNVLRAGKHCWCSILTHAKRRELMTQADASAQSVDRGLSSDYEHVFSAGLHNKTLHRRWHCEGQTNCVYDRRWAPDECMFRPLSTEAAPALSDLHTAICALGLDSIHLIALTAPNAASVRIRTATTRCPRRESTGQKGAPSNGTACAAQESRRAGAAGAHIPSQDLKHRTCYHIISTRTMSRTRRRSVQGDGPALHPAGAVLRQLLVGRGVVLEERLLIVGVLLRVWPARRQPATHQLPRWCARRQLICVPG